MEALVLVVLLVVMAIIAFVALGLLLAILIYGIILGVALGPTILGIFIGMNVADPGMGALIIIGSIVITPFWIAFSVKQGWYRALLEIGGSGLG
jgi:hypothetical protein